MAKQLPKLFETTLASVVERRIHIVRGHKVILDSDLANLYDVETRVLIQAVKRNKERFPEDFMIQMTWKEASALRSQNVILNSSALRSQNAASKRGHHTKYQPYVFTEQGIAMLSSVLHSKRAIQVNVAIMRTFVKLREMLATHKDLAEKIQALEKKYDKQFRVVFKVIYKLMEKDALPEKQNQIGFRT